MLNSCKLISFCTLFLCSFNIGYAQKLTPEEVIDYLNKISIEYPEVRAGIREPKDSSYTYYTFNNLRIDYALRVYSVYMSSYLLEKRINNLEDLALHKPYKKCHVDIQSFNIQRKKTNDSFGCIEEMIVRNPLVIVRDPLDGSYRQESYNCSIYYDCTLSGVLDVYADALKYMSSISLSINSTSKIIENPFSKNDLKPININLSKKGSLFYIKTKVSNKEVDFIFDSGASDCSLNANTFDSIFQINPNAFTSLEDGLYKLADGSIKKQKRYLLNAIDINGRITQNIELAISPIGSPNLLGNSFLKLFKKWTLNQEQQTLVLEY